MKKRKAFCGLLLTVFLLLTGCSEKEEEFRISLPDVIERVEVTYCHGAENVSWELVQDEIPLWENWVEGLSLEKQAFEEGNSPGDADGGEAYSFLLNAGEKEWSYILTGKEYILLDEEWYLITNPAKLPLEIPKTNMQDRIPMVMVDGKLYYDTGKESTLSARCGTMDGEITTTVDTAQIPAQDNQSNFGTGYGYQYTGENMIELFINNKWIVFEYREE